MNDEWNKGKEGTKGAGRGEMATEYRNLIIIHNLETQMSSVCTARCLNRINQFRLFKKYLEDAEIPKLTKDFHSLPPRERHPMNWSSQVDGCIWFYDLFTNDVGGMQPNKLTVSAVQRNPIITMKKWLVAGTVAATMVLRDYTSFIGYLSLSLSLSHPCSPLSVRMHNIHRCLAGLYFSLKAIYLLTVVGARVWAPPRISR